MNKNYVADGCILILLICTAFFLKQSAETKASFNEKREIEIVEESETLPALPVEDGITMAVADNAAESRTSLNNSSEYSMKKIINDPQIQNLLQTFQTLFYLYTSGDYASLKEFRLPIGICSIKDEEQWEAITGTKFKDDPEASLEELTEYLEIYKWFLEKSEFGAVDYECQVWVNNKLVGSHKGGNNPFSFNITKYLRRNSEQIVEVSVTDPTDTESISRGKQQLNQEGIWYTPVSGIWQTVWIEAVNKTCIKQVLPVADIYKKSVKLSFD